MQRRAFIAVTLLSATGLRQPPRAASTLVYFGTYTNKTKSRGIYLSRLDSSGGTLSPPELVAETPNPSFLALHPQRPYLYAANEVADFGGTPSGSVSAFAIDRATGRLSLLNQQSSAGGGPAHLTVDRGGRNVLVANYGGGSVAVLPVDDDGRLQPAASVVQHTGSSINPQRQKEPHAHAIVVDPGNRFAYAVDLGLDRILIYRFDAASGRIAPHGAAQVTAGSGPRHFAFHPTAPFAYVINELTCTITAFRRDESDGGLQAMQTISTLPAGEIVRQGYSTAEVQVHPSGRFLYGSNRGHDSIAVFAVDAETGQLSLVQHEPTGGSTPRNFGIDPAGAWLLAANQRSDTVVVFRIDANTGRLTPTGGRIEVGAPVCVTFDRNQ